MSQRSKAQNQDILAEIFGPNWLEENAPELNVLEQKDNLVKSIIQFFFLWIIFEGRALKAVGGQQGQQGQQRQPRLAISKKIEIFCNQRASSECVGADCAFKYFYGRYVTESDTNEKFDILFQDEDCRPQDVCSFEFVKRVLLGREVLSEQNVMRAWLIVGNRIRNRLFHGPKVFQDQLTDQLDNFTHTNEALTRAIELNQKHSECN